MKTLKLTKHAKSCIIVAEDAIEKLERNLDRKYGGRSGGCDYWISQATSVAEAIGIQFRLLKQARTAQQAIPLARCIIVIAAIVSEYEGDIESRLIASLAKSIICELEG